MIARIKIYIILGLLATISFLGLYVKILNQDLSQYEQLEKIESKKQKITKQYVKKIQKIKVPADISEFERLLERLQVPE